MRHEARQGRRSATPEPLPSDRHRLSDGEVLRQRVHICWELLSKAVEALDDAPPEVQVFLVMGLEVMTEAKELIEGRR